MVYQDSRPLAPGALNKKDSIKLEIFLHVKIFNNKTKNKSNTPASMEKNNFFLFKKTISCI